MVRTILAPIVGFFGALFILLFFCALLIGGATTPAFAGSLMGATGDAAGAVIGGIKPLMKHFNDTRTTVQGPDGAPKTGTDGSPCTDTPKPAGC